MSYDPYEVAGGRPIELYRFVWGTTVMRWTSAASIMKRVEPDTGTQFDYVPQLLERTELELVDEARTSNLQISVSPDNAIAALFAASQPDVPVYVTIYRRQWDDPAAEFRIIFDGEVKTCQFGPGATGIGSGDAEPPVLVCGPMQDRFQRAALPVLYQMPCGNELYGLRCGVDKTAHTHAGYTVTAVSTSVAGMLLTLDAAASAFFAADTPTGRLQSGLATIGTESQMIVVHNVGANTILLLESFKATLVLPQAITLIDGCDRTIIMCHDRFNNVARHQGYGFIPTKNPFGGQSLI